MKHKPIYLAILKLFVFVALVAVLVLPTQRAQAAACVSQIGGLWSDPATWVSCDSGIPGSDDTVSIGHAVTVDTTDRMVISLAITSGGSLTLNADLTLTAGTGYILDLAGNNIDLYNHRMLLSGNGGDIRVCNGTNTISDSYPNGAGIFLMTATISSTKSVVTTGCSPAGTLTFDSPVNVQLVTATVGQDYSHFNPGNGLTTINGTLTLQAGSGVYRNSPSYGPNSELIYDAAGTTIPVATEWRGGGATSGAGVPQVVDIRGSTNIQFNPMDGLHVILGNITLGSGAQISLADCDTCHLSFRGTEWMNNGATFSGSEYGRVIFEGPDIQTIGGGTTEFPNLEINNTAGVYLNVETKVTMDFYMTAGNVDLLTYDLILGSLGGQIFYNGSPGPSHMIIANPGRLCKAFGNTYSRTGPFEFLYTIGDNDTYYSPVDLDLPVHPLSGERYSNFTVCMKVEHDRHPNWNSGVTPYLNRYWKVTVPGGSAGPSPTFSANFQYNDPDDIVGNEAAMYSLRWHPATNAWTTYNPVDSGNNYVQVTNIPMALQPTTGADYTGGNSNPTAVTMANMEAIRMPTGQALVRWTTAMELNTLGFNLYRSISPDGARTLLTSDMILAQSPGQFVETDYQYEDLTAQAGVSYYYWIEEVDTAGSTFYGPLQALSYLIHLPILLFH